MFLMVFVVNGGGIICKMSKVLLIGLILFFIISAGLNVFAYASYNRLRLSAEEMGMSSDQEHATLEACREVMVTLANASDYQNDLFAEVVRNASVPTREQLDEYARLFSLNDVALEKYNQAQQDKEEFYKNAQHMGIKFKGESQ